MERFFAFGTDALMNTHRKERKTMKDDSKVIDLGKELRKEERRKKFEAFKKKASDWWDRNKVYVAVAAPVAGKVMLETIKAFRRNHVARIELRNKDLRLYDTSLGHYWELRRKLNNSDWVTINRRRNLGESLGDILEEMRVLK